MSEFSDLSRFQNCDMGIGARARKTGLFTFIYNIFDAVTFDA